MKKLRFITLKIAAIAASITVGLVLGFGLGVLGMLIIQFINEVTR